jgi:DNA-binding PadR family transcriptional regulator
MTEHALYHYLLEHPDEDHYSLALSEAIGARLGTIYPTLIRLKKRGHLSSHWETLTDGETRRPCRLYRLTGPGYLAAREGSEG